LQKNISALTPRKMKVSVCITVFNEQETIGKLLDSLLFQTKKPKEIVIVDGGSKDKTVQRVKHYQKKDKRIKLLIEPGNVAHGRNTSIEVARYPIIVHIDAGCTARADWLEKITSLFKHREIDVVAGFYKMKAAYSMQKAMNVYHGVVPERFDAITFFPSARSFAFRKKVWEEVGGYNEKLEKAGEDTEFIYKIIRRGFKMAKVMEAQVLWNEPAEFSFKDSLKKFYQYAKGDAQAGIWLHPKRQVAAHNIKISAVFVRYFLGFALLIFSIRNPALFVALVLLLLLYIFFPIFKWRDVIGDWKARAWLPVIQISSDAAVMAGFIYGKIVR